MITEIEKEAARFCIEHACSHGAEQARISLNKSVMDTIATLDGEIDKVTHNADCSIYMYLFADGRYGTFSTNKLDKDSLAVFISNALEMVRTLGPDECWKLPAKERLATDARDGNELGLYDPAYLSLTTDERLGFARSMDLDPSLLKGEDHEVICVESEWSDSIDDNYLIDSQGFEGRQTETSFSVFSEVTVQDKEGHKYSGYWWDASSRLVGCEASSCSRKALEKAISQIGPEEMPSGHYTMITDPSVSSRLVSPILNALNASSIQQKVSFLEDSLERRLFPEGLTLMDLARTPGRPGSRLFDTEGVATTDSAIISDGVVKEYFVNTYMAAKMGIAPTVEDISRPCLLPYLKDENLKLAENDINLADIMAICHDGIVVTGFNGGNCNSVTGDFSFGVEGFAFKDGKRLHPIKGMLITGNILELWNHLIAAGTDARSCSRWQIPSLAFGNVSFSA